MLVHGKKVRIVFPYHSYDSYSDLRRWVYTSSIPTAPFHELGMVEDTVDIFCPVNGQFHEHRSVHPNVAAGSHVVWWNLERADSGPSCKILPEEDARNALADDIRKLSPYVSGVFVSDRSYMGFHTPHIPVCHVPIGLPEGWDVFYAPYSKRSRTTDFSVLSYFTYRRSCMVGALRAEGYTVGPNAWGYERTAQLMSSKFLMSMHQTDMKVGEPLRYALAVEYGLPLLAEDVDDPYPMVEGVHFLKFSRDTLLSDVKSALSTDPLHLQEVVDNFSKLYREVFTLEQSIRSGVECFLSQL